MSKSKHKKLSLVTTDELLEELELPQKPLIITSAVIKDMVCNYGYEIKTGPGKGDKIPTRKGSSLVHPDMNEAFNALKVHLAILDDAFKPLGFEDFDDMRAHDCVDDFYITGFKITGQDENEGIILLGEKSVTHGSIGLETPKISASSSYPFYDPLKESIENARTEVELYMNGKVSEEEQMPELPFPEDTDPMFDTPID